MSKFFDKYYSATFAEEDKAKNPYLRVGDTARLSRSQTDDYARSAADLEAQQLLYEQQLSDEERLIAEQRAYESPAAERARRIAAGENPDLTNGSSSGSGSSPSVPSPSLTFGDTTNSAEEASLVAGTVGSYADALQSAISSVNSAVTLSQGIKRFTGDMRVLGQQQTLNDQAIASGNMENILKSVGMFGDIASTMDPIVGSDGQQVTPSLEQVKDHLSALGIDDPSGSLSSGVFRFAGSKALQKLYNDRIVSARQSAADAVSMSFQALREITSNRVMLDQVQSDLDLHSAEWESAFRKVYETEDSALLAGETQLNSMMNDALGVQFDQAKVQRSIDAWYSSLSYVQSKASQLYKEIQALKSQPSNNQTAAQIASKEISLNELLALGDRELSRAFSIMRFVRSSDYKAAPLLNDENETRRYGAARKERYFTFADILFSTGSPDVNDPLSSLSQTLLDLLSFVTKKPKTTTINIAR